MKLRHLAILILLFLVAGNLVAQTSCKPKLLSPATFSEQLSKTKHAQLVDIRDPDELKYGYLTGAININYYDKDFEQQMLAQLKKDKPVMIYCMSGYRSGKVAKRLCELGFKEVYDMLGGAYAWEKAGFPVK
jgi:thioredoxin 1